MLSATLKIARADGEVMARSASERRSNLERA
jgi:hypothetical protein